jgi:hypothetical protein
LTLESAPAQPCQIGVEGSNPFAGSRVHSRS